MGSVESPSEYGNVVLDYLSWASCGAQSAHDAVKGKIRGRRDIATHGRCHYVYDLKILRASAATGIALETPQEFRIVAYQRLKVRSQILHVVPCLCCRMERKHREYHPIFDRCLARETGAKPVVALNSVDRRACPTEPTAAAATAQQSVS
jgi:head-tail adaptor